MSSLQNAHKSQRTHRERHQPEARKKLGLLEKRSDYKARANDYNTKKATLKKLAKKTLNKNPDEFYHHMIGSGMKDGVHYEKTKQDVLTAEQVKLMQTQDLRYVTYKRNVERKKIERLQAGLHLLDESDRTEPNKHTFFVDSQSEVTNFDLAKQLDTHPSLLAKTSNRIKMSDLASDKISRMDPETLASVQKRQYKAYRELQQRIDRERSLVVVQEKMEAKKQLQNKKDKPVKVVVEETKESAPVIKWAKERKR